MTEEVTPKPRKRAPKKKPEQQETALLFLQLLNTQGLVGKVPVGCPLLKGLPADSKAEDYTVLIDPVFMIPVNTGNTLTIARGYLGVPFLHSPVKELPVRHWNILYCVKVESEIALRTYHDSLTNPDSSPFAAVFEASKALLDADANKARETAEAEARRAMEQQEALFHMATPSKIPS